jgi:hypothetical protein
MKYVINAVSYEHVVVSFCEQYMSIRTIDLYGLEEDRLCGLVVRVLGYRSGGPDSIPGTTRKKK